MACFIGFGQENRRDRRGGVFYWVWTGTVETGDLAWFYLGLDRRTGATGGVYGAIVRVASLGVPIRHAL